MRKTAFWLLYAAFLAGIFLGVMLLCEVCVRLSVPQHVWKLCVARDDWQADVNLGWVNIPNLDVTSRDDGPDVRFHLNPDGLQPASATAARLDGAKRIMIFGDSGTVGRAVIENERLAFQLQQQLVSRGTRLEVICAGVQGYSTDQTLLLMQRLLPRYRPDVVIHLVCDNDFGGNESSVAYGLAKPRFALTQEQTLQLVPTSREAIEETWRKVWSHDLRDYLQCSALYRFIRPALFRFRYGSAKDWRQDNLLGGAGAQEQIETMAKADWKLFTALVREMNETCRKHGTAFILSQHPHAWETWDKGFSEDQHLWLHRRLQSVADEVQTRFCGVVPYFLQHRDEGPFHLLPRDPHCNGKGYELTARCFAGYLQTSGLLDPAPLVP